MSAELLVDDAKAFKGAMSAVETLVEEATFKVDPESGVSLAALEPAKTAMVLVILPRPFFSELKAEGERFVGVNFTELMRILKRVKATETIGLTLEEANLRLEIAGHYTRRFKLPLLSGEPFKMKELKVDFKAGVRIEAKRFPSMVKDLSLVGNEVEIEIEGSKASYRARGHRRESEIEITKEDPILVDIWAEEPSKSTYSLAYLDRISNPADIAHDMTMELANNTPMRIRYSLGFEGASITYYLAHLSV